MKNQRLAYKYAIFVVLFWSTVASAFKITLRHLDFLNLVFFAIIVSIITLFVVLCFQRKLNLFKKYKKNDYLRSALLGFLNPFLYYIILFKAYSILPAQEALSLNYLWAITLTLLSIPILKQKISFMSIFAIFISFIGVIIIATHGNILSLKFTNPIGVSLALSSTIVWSLFWIYNVKDTRDDVAKLLLNFLFGFIFILITFLFTRKLSIPSIKGLLGASYAGIFEMGITFILWLKALSLSKTTSKVSNIIYLSPFISLVIIRFAVGEEILASTVIGLLLIVIGIMVQRRTP